MKKIIILLFCFPMVLFAKEPSDLYIEALEALLQENETEAISLFEQLVEEYPESEYVESSEERLIELSSYQDQTGVVGFYTGTLASSALTAFGIIELLDLEDASSVVYGSIGIAAIGGGVGLSYLLTKDINMSAAQDLWIETSQIIAMANSHFLYNGFIGDNPEEFSFGLTDFHPSKYWTVQVPTIIASRGLSYYFLKDENPEAGRAAMFLSAYGWSQYYYWISMNGLFKSENKMVNNLLGVLIPDLLTAGSWFLWDNLRWSTMRTGMISVGGIAGGLVGIFTNAMLAEIEDLPEEVGTGVLLGTTLLGQAAAVYFTKGLEPDLPFALDELNFQMSPVFQDKGFGFNASLSL